MIKNIANIITGFRIIGSIMLLFFPVFSVMFYSIYLLCGFSDMIDGTIARKTSSNNELGSKMDTVADMVFLAASLTKVLPTIHIPVWIWIWSIVIAIIKIGNIIWGYVSKKQFISLHTIMNKLTGFLLFLFPLSLSFLDLKYSFAPVCMVATFSAIEESVYITTGFESK